MSDLYRLALALRAAPDSSLNLVVQERSLTLEDYKDFFDLANALLNPKSLSLLQAAIPNQSLLALRALAAGDKIPSAKVSLLSQQFLVWGEEGNIYDWLKDRLQEKPKTSALAIISDAVEIDQEAIDRDCGLSAFEAMQAMTELIFDFDQHLIREVSKGSIGLPDIKRLATQLGKNKEYVKAIFELAKLAGIISLTEKRFQPTDLAEQWLEKSPADRWIELANSWLIMLGAAGAQEVTTQLKSHPGKKFSQLVQQSFPFLGSAPTSRIARLADLANYIGLAMDYPASWLGKLLAGSTAEASKALATRLPAEQGKILIQADLSIVAPGPLASALEAKLRRFSQTESIGLASSFRLSALTLSSGMESGLSEGEIRNFLETLSGQALPQPVDYLIRESAERFGRIRISNLEGKSIIQCDAKFLTKQLLMDSKIKQLGLTVANNEIVSTNDTEVVYHALREAGYLAVQIDQQGKILNSKARHHSASVLANFNQQLQRLRQQDIEMEESSPKDDMERKIQLALKSKSILEIEIAANGKQMTFQLEPIGIANGRLRARDRKADIERTLPVSSITSISIG